MENRRMIMAVFTPKSYVRNSAVIKGVPTLGNITYQGSDAFGYGIAARPNVLAIPMLTRFVGQYAQAYPKDPFQANLRQ
jgi:hypothetical protein